MAEINVEKTGGKVIVHIDKVDTEKDKLAVDGKPVSLKEKRT
jgi:hypothetical protein